MYRKPLFAVLPVLVCGIAWSAGDVARAGEEAWKDKQVAEWSPDDAKQVMTDSPWAKTTTPALERSADGAQRRPGGGGGGRRGGGIGFPGGGIGFPGGGGGGRRYPGGGGGGYPNGGPNGGQSGSQDGSNPRSGDTPQIPTLTLRWESAQPMREAELKARDTSAPTIDEDHYAIAVYGVPRRQVDDTDSFANNLKKQASIKRDGKKDLKPSGVRVIEREDGPVIVFLFPRTNEITKKDRRLEFDAQVGKLKFTQSFYPEDMVFQGKLEL